MGDVDPLSRLLSGVRASSSVTHRTVVEPPFGLRIEEGAHLALATVLTGSCLLLDDDGTSAELGPGRVALVTGPRPFVLADSAETEPTLVVRPDGQYAADGSPLPPPPDVATCELDPGGSTVVVSGSFVVAGQVSTRLLDSLPRFAVCEVDGADLALDFLTRELDSPAPGRDAALDRWLDLALVTTLRRWLAEVQHTPGWYAGISDPVVGPALQAMHEDLAAPWSVAGLARESAVSRSAFGARFTAVVGESPMAYLARARLDAAADLLSAGGESLTTVADRVGYSSPFALSAAFKRHTGVSPSQWRRQRRLPA